MAPLTTRDFPLPSGGCGVPSAAKAYSLNVTVVPNGPLGFLTLWPTGQARPFVSTLNSLGGDILANAAIVPAGTGGSISVYVTGQTDVVIDINGYFAPSDFVPPAGSASLVMVPVTPCRVADTRPGQSTFGLLGPPILGAGTKRDFPVLSSSCGIPAGARAYSVNVTVVPTGPLGYLSAWPSDVPPPLVSTLNSLRGKILANAAIIPAAANGDISIFVTNLTDVIIDINGYFAEGG